MKDKIINSFIDEETGISRIVIKNKYGEFCGFAFCNEKDKPTFSKYVGARYAEIKANMEFYKFRIKQEKIKLKAIKDLEKDIKHNISSLDSPEQKAIMRRINLAKRDYTDRISCYQNLYDFLVDYIPKIDAERHEILNRKKKDK